MNDETDWYKGFWRSDALPIGVVVLMLILVFLMGAA
jgi:hypothetical protein